jgi:hypothetical protein
MTAQRMTIAEAYELLDAIGAQPRRTRDRIRSRCPVHEGDRPDSLAIVAGSNGTDFAAACHSECGAGGDFFTKLLDRLRTGEAMAPPDPAKAGSHSHHGARDNSEIHLEAEHLYTPIGQDRPMWKKCRYRTANGRKTFRWYRWTPIAGGVWAQGLARQPEQELPLYGWQALEGHTGPVYWVEGEKSVDRAALAGLVAVTSCGGAKGPLPDDLQVMAGRDVIVVADRDPEGNRYAVRVEGALTAIGCNVRIARTPIDHPKADLADHLDAGLAVPGDLEYAPAREQRPPATRHGIRFHWAADDQPEHVTWLIDGFMPAHCLIIVAGREGAGKSTLAAMLIAQATSGCLTGTPEKVLVLGTEDGWRSRWIPRLHASGADLARVSRDPEVVTITEDGEELVDLLSIADQSNLARLAAAMAEEGVGLLYLDHLGDALAVGTDQNAYGQVTAALKTINRWAMANHITVIGGWHLTKGGGRVADKIIGSVGFRTSARCLAVLAEDPETRARLLAIDKCNDLDPSATPAKQFTITATDIPINDRTFNTTVAGPLSDHHQASGKEVVQHLIDEATAQADTEDQVELKDDVADFIRQELTSAGGQMPAKDILEKLHAKFKGIGGSTITKAKRVAGAKSARAGESREVRIWLLLDSRLHSVHSHTRVQESTESRTESSPPGRPSEPSSDPGGPLPCGHCGHPNGMALHHCSTAS